MRTIYLDCGMGAAGDMLAGALLELVEDKEAFINKIGNIGIDGVLVLAEESVKCGITGTHIRVIVDGQEEHSHDVHEHHHGHDEAHHHDHHHDHGEEYHHDHHHSHEEGHHHHASLADIHKIIDGLNVSEKVKNDVKEIYRLVAEAESRVHGKEVAEVHFHEVGMLDAVCDITMTAMLIEELKPEQIIASPINVGFGKVKCAHGILPVPAPATLHLLAGIPCYSGKVEGELCTPTGAALLKYYVNQFGNLPQMTMEKAGYGMGNKDFPVANCVRAVLGATESSKDEVVELRCNIDDMTPEEMGYALELLLENGALDVYTIPVGMKKSRTGILLNVMCRESLREKMTELIFKHTTTIGIREYRCNRIILEREEYTKNTELGDVRIKRVKGYGITREKMEYDDLKRIARDKGCSIREIRKMLGSEG